MGTAIQYLSEIGLRSIGLCSSLWTDASGDFKAGLFLYESSLHLVIRPGGATYYVAPVHPDSVEHCLRGGSSLYDLLREQKKLYHIRGGRIVRADLLHRLRIRVSLLLRKPIPLPNNYYIWSEYYFEQRVG